jgi:four helix bundle protein
MQNYNSKFKSDLHQRCYTFGINVIKLTDGLPNKRSAWVIADQLIRSSTSIGANLIEGKAASSRLEFKKFYEIALKSANETKYWLSLLRDAGLAEQKVTNDLLQEVTEISNMLGAGVIKLKNKNF